MRIVVFTAASLAAMLVGAAHSAELKLLHTTAIKPPIDQLVASYETKTGNKVTAIYGPAGAIVQRVRAGEQFDVVVATSTQISDLETEGSVLAGSKRDLAKVGIGLYVKKGATKPDVSSVEKFKQALLAARSIAYIDPSSGGASGIYVAGLLERLQIAGTVKPKANTPKVVAEVFDSVASGKSELGLGQLSEIVIDTRIELAGMLPAEIQNITLFAVGIARDSKNKDAAMALAEFVAAPDAQAAFKQFGFEQP